MNVTADRHRTHGHGGIGQALGHGDDIRNDAEGFRGRCTADAAKGGDDLVKDQHNAMLARDLAQPLQIADRRHQHACRPRHGLNDHRGDGLWPMQGNDRFQRVSQMAAPLRTTFGETIVLKTMGVGQMVDPIEQGPELATVIDNAAHRNAAKANAILATLAADEAGSRALAA